jgi:hypothetical protein
MVDGRSHLTFGDIMKITRKFYVDSISMIDNSRSEWLHSTLNDAIEHAKELAEEFEAIKMVTIYQCDRCHDQFKTQWGIIRVGFPALYQDEHKPKNGLLVSDPTIENYDLCIRCVCQINEFMKPRAQSKQNGKL